MRRILFLGIVILLVACSEKETVTPELAVNPSIIEFDDGEGTKKIHLVSNTSWVSKSSQDWCKASILQNIGSDTIEIRVTENPSENERIAYVSFLMETIIKTVKVIQKGVQP